MRGTILAGVVVALALAFAAPSSGATLKPWDGTNPFVCTMQYAGEGTTFPNPNADPFCVDYDKTHQDITELGLVKFLTKEPARVAAAVDKCWYFQQDHWTGQVIAGDGSTETYHFDGHYFFDKRWGAGGVYVENFTINHRTADPSQLPGFPAAWKAYFGPGRGGVMMSAEVRADPQCQPPAGGGSGGPSPYKHEADISGGDSHHSGGGSGGGGSSGSARPGTAPGHPVLGGRARSGACVLRGGARHGLGPAHLGQRRVALVRRLGRPSRSSHGYMFYCDMAIHLGKHGRADFIGTVSKAFHSGRVRVGARLRAARAALHGERVLVQHGSGYIFTVNHRGWRLLVGAKHGRVTFLAAASSRLSFKQLGLRLSGR